ncbi:MAG: hypothetical protein H9864_06170 [Candidatus Faecalibacterium intestinavium]|uniref:Uncharacterized protein n=1 Tax=Candidatus Faecalibacterium intestinavium TaxID=2838580 RepID=A0A9E2NQU0_9FIRM|nr:hypothetical protein [Candidatus Faecalibacterium intestinavium]
MSFSDLPAPAIVQGALRFPIIKPREAFDNRETEEMFKKTEKKNELLHKTKIKTEKHGFDSLFKVEMNFIDR